MMARHASFIGFYAYMARSLIVIVWRHGENFAACNVLFIFSRFCDPVEDAEHLNGKTGKGKP